MHTRKQKRFATLRWIRGSLIAWSLLTGLQTNVGAEIVRISYSAPAASFLPLIVARQNGYFDEKGLTAQIIQMAPQLQIAGLINNEIDYVSTFQNVAVRPDLVVQGASPRLTVRETDYIRPLDVVSEEDDLLRLVAQYEDHVRVRV